jgi:hypothetical protein
MASIFRGAHDDDDVGGTRFIPGTLASDSHRQRTEIAEHEYRQDKDQKRGCALEVRYSYVNIVCAAEADGTSRIDNQRR